MVAPLALRARLRDEDGISLVEMLIAIVLLGVVMGAMARSLTTSLFGVQGQERVVQATAQMQESLEQVNGVVWEDAGLCESDVDAHFGGTTYTHADGTTEPIVVLDDDHSSCTGTPLLVPERTVTRQGVDYTVATVVTWTDDDLDNDGTGTDPNSTQDTKHVLVTITWEHRGEPRSASNETFLAPNALEQPLRTRVEHDSGETFTYLRTADNLTLTDVYLRAFSVVPQSGITVTWARQDGSSVGPQPMIDVSGDGTEWELLIPNGSPEFTINKLPNGETLFRFAATDAASGSTATVLDRGLFIVEQVGHEFTSQTLPASIRVKDGVACSFTLETTIRGALSSDLVSATWTNGPDETALSSVSSSSTGGTFRAVFTGETGFAGGSTDLTIGAVRIADGHVVELVRTLPVEELEAEQTC
jgi:type II secretory pathway pseudopilin PulG